MSSGPTEESTPAGSSAAPDTWNIMTRTRGGTVSLLKNLTEDEARDAMQRLRRPLDMGDPWSNWAIRAGLQQELEMQKSGAWQSFGGLHQCSDGDLEQIECWSASGRSLEIWPIPADYYDRKATITAAFCVGYPEFKQT